MAAESSRPKKLLQPLVTSDLSERKFNLVLCACEMDWSQQSGEAASRAKDRVALQEQTGKARPNFTPFS